MALRRWSSGAALGGLMMLTVGAAAWSVANGSGYRLPHARQSPRRSFVPVTVATPSPATTTTTTTPRILAISTTGLRVGDQVTMTGTGCPPGAWGTPVVQSDDDPFVFSAGSGGLYDLEEYFLTPGGDDAGGTVGTDGRWTVTAMVPMVPPGPATLTGWCMPQEGDDGASIEFNYLPGLRVTVTTPDEPVVEEGTTVDAGTTLHVTLLGSTCPGVSHPFVDLYTGSQIQVVTATASTVSGWPYALALPPGLTPGQYRLEADCVYSRGAVYGSYAPLTITVR